MSLSKISSSTIALLIASLVVLLTGTYTDNGGFQLAGVLLLLVSLILGFNQARKRSGSA